MNKKAFVLMETIVVIVVISVALLTIFASYNKILTKVKTENKYDTSEYIYMTDYIKKYMQNECSITSEDIYGTITEHFNYGCEVTEAPGINSFKVKRIYVLKNINSGDDAKFEKFDAYMIDYIRKLDVGDNDTLIVVEFFREALDDKGNPIYTTSCPKDDKDDGGNDCLPLTETYIASLEWDE